jgi:hypothetical protein
VLTSDQEYAQAAVLGEFRRRTQKPGIVVCEVKVHPDRMGRVQTLEFYYEIHSPELSRIK